MKNKKVLAIVIAVLLLALVGGFIYVKSKSSKVETNNIATGNKSVISSVKDALTQKLTLSCEFTDESGTIVKSYIKNGAVRVTSVGSEADKSGEIIMKDKKMYIWDTTTKVGFVYEIEDQAVDGADNPSQENITSDSYLDMINKYKDSCKVATVADSYFVPPTDVNFQDMTKFLENMQNQVPQIEIPSE